MKKEEKFPYDIYKQIYLDQNDNKEVDEEIIRKEYEIFLNDDSFDDISELLEMLLGANDTNKIKKGK